MTERHYYYCYHPSNPDGGVTLKFFSEPSPMRVRDKACNDGHFKWEFYTELRVRKTKKPIPITPLIKFREVPTKENDTY